jgi:Na+-transporting NADH:ubiquinone oxidoreductase subunit NqrC
VAEVQKGEGEKLMSLREHRAYPIAYMFALTAVCSLILIGFARFTAGRVEANQRLAFERAAVRALAIELPEQASGLEIHEVFTNRVRQLPSLDALDDAKLEAHGLLPDGADDADWPDNLKDVLERVEAVGIVVRGRGFWDQIEGVIGVRYDKSDGLWKLTGIAFYQQRETPGLGAEITTPRFTAQFSRDKVISKNPPPLTFVAEGAEAGPSEINQITGATQTCSRLEGIINDHLSRWIRAVNQAVK